MHPPKISGRRDQVRSQTTPSAPGRVASRLAQPGARDRSVAPRLRMALYSHDAVGLGHVRRNMIVAGAMVQAGVASDVLVISGAAEVALFPSLPGVDCLTLPRLRKEVEGRYAARTLDLSLADITALRGRTIEAALDAFRPDIFVVDKVPRGVAGELSGALERLRRDPSARCVLGLRDVLDEPAAVRDEWGRLANDPFVRTHFDAVWVYGDSAVYDLIGECGFPADVVDKAVYTGYFDRQDPSQWGAEEQRFGTDPTGDLELPERFVLCMVGGGQDGAALAQTFASGALPAGTNGIILAGPFMPASARKSIHQLCARSSTLRVVDFISEPIHLIRRAERVIAMGGYNTVSEILSLERPALIVPRVAPRNEQWIRAHRLEDLGLVEVCDPDNLSSRVIREWLEREAKAPQAVRDRIRFDGLQRLPELARELVEWRAREAEAPIG